MELVVKEAHNVWDDCLDLYLRDGLKKGDRNAPHARRLRALMCVWGFDPDVRGNQPRFAKSLRIETPQLNNVLRGYPLSWQLARVILRRYPGVSADFLFLGKAGGHLDRTLEQQLYEYEDRTGIEVFTRSVEL